MANANGNDGWKNAPLFPPLVFLRVVEKGSDDYPNNSGRERRSNLCANEAGIVRRG